MTREVCCLNDLLWESAEHWLENWAHPEKAKIYSQHCPLCAVFLAESFQKCAGCPVARLTGQPTCYGTPWDAVNAIIYKRDTTFPPKQAPSFSSLKRAMEMQYMFLVCLALGEIDEARELCPKSSNG